MAGIEFSISARLYLNQRIPDAGTLQREISALEFERTQKQPPSIGQFPSEDARLKLKRLHPSFFE
jgi:hypothetical protein